ncbi:MAG: hypothetical protein WB509_16135 [Acetobacteraceae bacterium]
MTAEARIRPLRPSDHAPVNTGSVAFHRRMGFRIMPGDADVGGIAVVTGYDGPGQDRVRFVRDLSS